MRRTVQPFIAGALALLGLQSAWSQDTESPPPTAPTAAGAEQLVVPKGRADENVVRQAEDAFGATIGRETIGIYSSESVRGFSPIAAGNARIDGLYYDQATPPNSRIRRSTSIRVGISAQGYLSPAPTGVVDYALRRPGTDRLLSTTLDYNTYDEKSLELDAELPVAGNVLSVGAGLGLYDHVFQNGTTSKQHVEGLTLRWRPRPGVELLPFYGRSYISDDEIGPLLTVSGPFLPPRIRRGVYYGPPWADYTGPAETYGLVSSASFAGNWKLEAGLFHSMVGASEDIYPYLDQITQDGHAHYSAFSDPPYLRESWSGEARLTRDFLEGPRTHAVTVLVRGRGRYERTGGSAFLDFGNVQLGDSLNFSQPPIQYGEYNRDRVHQWIGGLAYRGRWNQVGELSLGVSRADYSKRFQRPGLAEVRTHDTPQLYNAAGAIYLNDRLAVYGGYTRGLEETGLPPQNATNRNQALPAILTNQGDAGIRWRLAGDLKFVVGVFDIRKPYLSLDPSGLYTQLGDTQNKGIEASLSGTAVQGLSIALGGVWLDPQVTGAAQRLGRTGKRPTGVPLRSVDVNLDWHLPWYEPLSIDLGISDRGRIAATVDNSLYIPSRTLVNIGSRYRFSLGKSKGTLRLSLTNAFNVYAYDYQGPSTFDYIPQRLLTAYLAVDI